MRQRAPKRSQEIIKQLREETGLTIEQCHEVYDALFLNIIPHILFRDGKADIRSFGIIDARLIDRKTSGMIEEQNTVVAILGFRASDTLRKTLKEMRRDQD